MLLCHWLLDMPIAQFIARANEAIAPTTFWAGLVKAPAFAILIAMAGTYRGFQVRGSARELGRLTTHINETRNVLAGKGAIGRRLDFLMQEFNREANTLGSKAIDVRSTQAAVDMKVYIEQMREQVQNIE